MNRYLVTGKDWSMPATGYGIIDAITKAKERAKFNDIGRVYRIECSGMVPVKAFTVIRPFTFVGNRTFNNDR